MGLAAKYYNYQVTQKANAKIFIMEGNMAKDWGSTVITWPLSEISKIATAAQEFYAEEAAVGPRSAKIIEIIQSYQKALGYVK